jgi:hypothetical protein
MALTSARQQCPGGNGPPPMCGGDLRRDRIRPAPVSESDVEREMNKNRKPECQTGAGRGVTVKRAMVLAAVTWLALRSQEPRST